MRYCPVCASGERKHYEEAYWHRSHQLPGVLACEAHGTWLEESEVVLPAPVTRHAFVAAETAVPYDGFARRLSPAQNGPLILDLTRRAQALVTGSSPEFDLTALRSRYMNALAERKLATYSGRLRLEALRQDIATFLPENLRDRLGVPPVESWLLRLLRKPRTAAHSLHHLLLQIFLDTDHDVLETPIRFFGKGPWPCLNRAASHYGERRAVRKQAAALGLPYERPGSRAENAKTSEKVRSKPEEVAFAERRAACRSTWLEMKHKRPNASTKDLRADLPGVYIWLYRNDKAWLDENKPTRRVPRASAPRVDWARRDADLARLLRRAARQVLAEAKPVRVTRGRLGRMIGHAGMLDKNLDKLPICKAALDKLTESREAFAVRRIRSASSRLHESGRQVPRWQFVGCPLQLRSEPP